MSTRYVWDIYNVDYIKNHTPSPAVYISVNPHWRAFAELDSTASDSWATSEYTKVYMDGSTEHNLKSGQGMVNLRSDTSDPVTLMYGNYSDSDIEIRNNYTVPAGLLHRLTRTAQKGSSNLGTVSNAAPSTYPP